MRGLLRDHPDFEQTSDSDTFILTYRFVPRALRERMLDLIEAGMAGEALTLNNRINVLNAALQERQKRGGTSFVSRTVLESPMFADGITVLRIVLTNVATTPAHLAAILAEQRDIGTLLLRESGLAPVRAAARPRADLLTST
jgi:hypothetical protein